MTFGAILVAGAVQRSGDAAVAGVRADVLHKFGLVRRRWRRRASNASTSLEAVVGVAIIAIALIRVARAVADATSDDSSPTDTTPTDTTPQGTAAGGSPGARIAAAA